MARIFLNKIDLKTTNTHPRGNDVATANSGWQFITFELNGDNCTDLIPLSLILVS